MHFENHVGDDVFENPYTQERDNWYGVSSIPHVIFDGLGHEVGAGTCEGAADDYRVRINARLSDTASLSPVVITSDMTSTPFDVTITASYLLVEPVESSDLRATLLLYEDDIFWCCGEDGVDTWQHVTRVIYDEGVTLTNLGDEAIVETTIPLDPEWDPAELHAVAYLQDTATKEMIQGQAVGYATTPDFSSWFAERMQSLPEGNATATFDATLVNVSEASDTFTLEFGDTFGDWQAEFYVCGDETPHSGPLEIVLAPWDVCEIEIQVHTDGIVADMTGSFRITSAASGRTHETPLRIFNGSYAILFVDDDGGGSYEGPFTAGLLALGYLFEHYDIKNGHGGLSPTVPYLDGFDIVIWTTAWQFSQIMSDAEIAVLMDFMDNGGCLFLTSQEFLDAQGVPNTFTTDYLGVESWQLDKAYEQLDGVPGDPIGDGISLPLHFQVPVYKVGDDAVPVPEAHAVFLAPDGSHATIRYTLPNGAKSVFMPSSFNAISESDPDPNNTTFVLGRILEWIEPQDPADATEMPGAVFASRIDGIHPNPFSSKTEIAFTLSPAGAAGPVRLEIYDISGRRIAGILDGALEPGVHAFTWRHPTDRGGSASSGIYFARLSTREGVIGRKLILLE